MTDILKIDPKMILKITTDGKGKKDILIFLAEQLAQAGYVKDTYKDGILKREEIYPTGLFTGAINVAVPHTDCIHVNEDSIAVGLLNRPVNFKAMDNPEKDVPVSIVMMLALQKAHGQITMLQKILALVKEQELLKNLLKMNDLQKIYQIISNYLK